LFKILLGKIVDGSMTIHVCILLTTVTINWILTIEKSILKWCYEKIHDIEVIFE
jgi:hypothetical protein